MICFLSFVRYLEVEPYLKFLYSIHAFDRHNFTLHDLISHVLSAGDTKTVDQADLSADTLAK